MASQTNQKSQIKNSDNKNKIKKAVETPLNPPIRINDLCFYYGRHQVLKNISLEIKQNQISAIIGPSGSGKSSLLRTMNRIYELYPEQRTSGKIFINGQNIMDPKYPIIKLRRETGMVFQKPTPFPMTIFNNIAFAVKNHFKVSKSELADRVEWALKKAAVWDEVKNKLHKAGSHLSGGQQQRLCIARTIAIAPSILLLDEPTSALDPISTQKIEELILSLKEQYTIIMVTHNLKQAKRIADETIFLRDGEVIEHGITKKFFAHPKHYLTKEYLNME